ncbi:hypothetical protein AAVH_23228 [Aphelenchoides avenae]|nr:hypothetical protein AAVH_23228 [Aphelenchus avenae]
MRWQLVALLLFSAIVALTSAQGYYNYYGNSGYYPRYNNYYGNSVYGNNGYYNNGYGNNGYNYNNYNYNNGYNGYNNRYYNNYYSQQQQQPAASSSDSSSSSSSSSGGISFADGKLSYGSDAYMPMSDVLGFKLS